MVDETADISVKEQVSICFRIVNEKMDVEEFFVGFYTTESTKSITLFEIIMDVLKRFDIEVANCRGQCYDGAANMAGIFTGVQARFSEIEPRAIFVHCLAHSLNLVVQDSVSVVNDCRNVLNTARELINFVKSSPKRFAHFSKMTHSEDSVNLRPFCPTRWVIRHSSMTSIEKNYVELIIFFEDLAENDKTDAGAKSNGFLCQLKTFDFYFFLSLLKLTFCHIDIVNIALQKKSLCFIDANGMIETLQSTIKQLRTQFDSFWIDVTNKAINIELNEPVLPRQRRPPRRLDDGSDPHKFNTPKDYYRSKYYVVIDNISECLKSRFQTRAADLLISVENFLITGNLDNFKHFTDYYEGDFDSERLSLHCSMLVDIIKAKQKQGIENFNTLLTFIRNDVSCAMLPEINKLIKIILTIPVSTCTAERSFSSLRRLKSYTRSTTGQARLNSIAILHCHKELTSSLDLEEVANEFIKRNDIRRKTFAVPNPTK